MAQSSESARLAVLIDGDNTTPTIVEALLAEIAKYGSATIKRAYGDWTTPNLRGCRTLRAAGTPSQKPGRAPLGHQVVASTA